MTFASPLADRVTQPVETRFDSVSICHDDHLFRQLKSFVRGKHLTDLSAPAIHPPWPVIGTDLRQPFPGCSHNLHIHQEVESASGVWRHFEKYSSILINLHF
jgi:hypothetical protein